MTIKKLSKRQLRVGETLKRSFAKSFNEEIISQKLLMKSRITILTVIMSNDLKNAKIYFTISETMKDQLQKIYIALNKLSPILKYKTKKDISLKFMPNLHFYYDKSFDNNQKILKILHHPHIKQDL